MYVIVLYVYCYMRLYPLCYQVHIASRERWKRLQKGWKKMKVLYSHNRGYSRVTLYDTSLPYYSSNNKVIQYMHVLRKRYIMFS